MDDTETDLQFADTRTAYADLPDSTKEKISDWVLKHSQHHSRRVASPGHPMLDEPKVSPPAEQRVMSTVLTGGSSCPRVIPLACTSLSRSTKHLAEP